MTDNRTAHLEQEQFLEAIDRDEAERRFRDAIQLIPVGEETVSLDKALDRVLSRDVESMINVPSFDRSNYDGFATVAEAIHGADETHPKPLRLLDDVIPGGVMPQCHIETGFAVSIATGAVVPRGSDAIVKIEDTHEHDGHLQVLRAVPSGFGITYAGTDISAGETVLHQGDRLTSRETGVLAAIGRDSVTVYEKPRVAIISTGDEIIQPGDEMRPGLVYDSNARILADAVSEVGGIPQIMGTVKDNIDQLREILHKAIDTSHVVLMSGGTSKGAGDLSYCVVNELPDPGIVAHGVALKPGKPVCLAATNGKPVVVLPGFPTSAIFTFHEFVAPVIRLLAGRSTDKRHDVTARIAMRINSEIGRTEYLLVGLLHDPQPSDVGQREESYVAFPMGKGSGSVTAFSKADGFVTIDRHQEIVDADSEVQVTLLGKGLQVADLVVMGSHCTGQDFLIRRLRTRGMQVKFLSVGSSAGLAAAKRGECDVAGVHLWDEDAGLYNRPYLDDTTEMIEGYGRLQGIVFRRDDDRFRDLTADEVFELVSNSSDCLMVNRNQGSGTRMLIDRYLDGKQPRGYSVQACSHIAVAAAISQQRADWGVAIENVATQANLGFLPLTEERFDFVIPKQAWDKPAVREFSKVLGDAETRKGLVRLGFRP